MPPTLAEVENLVEQLSPDDRAALYARLAQRPSPLPLPPARHMSSADADAAVAAFRAVCDQLAAGSRPGENMTDAVSQMRR